MKKRLLTLALISTSTSLFAANIVISGYTPSQVTLHPSNSRSFEHAARPHKKEIMLQRITLSPQAKKILAKNVMGIAIKSFIVPIKNSSLPSQIENGMNRVPVLDQGRHGTCVTFATTGALDASYSKGDYISQLCNLELGSYLHEQNPSYQDGWEGAFGKDIFAQIEKYGVINTRFQKTEGCAGVFEYPLYDQSDKGHPYSIDEFTRHSEKIMLNIPIKPILNIADAMSDKVVAETILTQTKESIAAGHRIVIGMLLDEHQGENGAEGSRKVPFDSWILTPGIIQDAKNGKIDAGHALIITGYDDEAIIKGPNNTKHKGVFTLRNSWSELAGDKGNYYMSYDYFKGLVMEAIEVA